MYDYLSMKKTALSTQRISCGRPKSARRSFMPFFNYPFTEEAVEWHVHEYMVWESDNSQALFFGNTSDLLFKIIFRDWSFRPPF